MNMTVQLREIEDSDLNTLFEQQLDPVAVRMAAFTAKDPTDRQHFDTHWARIRADSTIILRSILADGRVAGSVLCHKDFGDPEISYWLGREFWGQGIATAALSQFLDLQRERPLFARAVKDNVASIRVLQKCGFKTIGKDSGFANGRGMEVEELILTLT